MLWPLILGWFHIVNRCLMHSASQFIVDALLAVHSSQPFFAFADAIAESDRSSVDLLPLEDDGDAE